MASVNDLFEQFPDYDVFSGKTEPVKNKQPLPHPEPVLRAGSDYGDGFGLADKPVKVKRTTGNNFLTVVFFPILILWLELVLRMACRESFNAISFLYLLGFTIPIATVLTLLCTFFGELFNRILCNIFAFTLTCFYITQLCYFSTFGAFLSFSSARPFSPEQFVAAISGNAFYVIALTAPFLLNLLFGHKIFGFRKLRIPAKLILIIAAVIIQIGTISALDLTKDAEASSSIIYNSSQTSKIQERFGIITMERLDLFNTYF
ncbi:MAG: hypothetical protein IJ903_06355 [Ruminococcus sp.]|nr:hypothetical protein [Ruminococcus sp.]